MLVRSLLALGILISTVSAHADPFVTQVNCSGKATDGRNVQFALNVTSASRTYPADATATLSVGADSAESLPAKLTMTSGQDVTGKTVYVFGATLTSSRAFAARSFDLKTGIGALRLADPLRAPMLSCTFTAQ